ncbi:MAG: hypothetical protein JWN84_4625 [Nocardioides sp.]|jgi:hypothetical protein|nr:hypothetical protein [Nocardioides sp.]
MVDDTTQQDTTTTSTKRRFPWQGRGGAAKGATTTTTSTTTDGGSGGGHGGGHGFDAVRLRKILAQVLWAICVVFALVLATAVLLIAVDANPKNDLVLWVINRADNVDLGFFDLTNPIKDWDEAETNPAQDVKTALFNYGIAAIVWLGIGKFLDKVVRA